MSRRQSRCILQGNSSGAHRQAALLHAFAAAVTRSAPLAPASPGCHRRAERPDRHCAPRAQAERHSLASRKAAQAAAAEEEEEEAAARGGRLLPGCAGGGGSARAVAGVGSAGDEGRDAWEGGYEEREEMDRQTDRQRDSPPSLRDARRGREGG